MYSYICAYLSITTPLFGSSSSEMWVGYLATILCNWNDDDNLRLYIRELNIYISVFNTNIWFPVISNSGHYIWYIYLNFAVTQTDDCELGLFCWCVEDGEVCYLQFRLVSRSEINNFRTVLYCTGSFFIDFLPCSDCQILKLFTKLFSIFWHIFLYK